MPDHSITAQSINRRNFLKVSGVGFFAALGLGFPSARSFSCLFDPALFPRISSRGLADLDKVEALLPGQQGRVLEAEVSVYDMPSFKGNRIKNHYRDTVLSLTGVTVGNSQDSFNLVWYRVGDGGYVHSGSLQPVFTLTNPVASQIPAGGTLAEVTVPFTDAHWDPGKEQPVSYRFYYATTYWVVEIVQDDNGEPWYGILDDKWDYIYYVPAQHLRIIPPDELQPISPDIPGNLKRIEVHLPEQVMVAYEADQPVYMARVASGARFSDGDYSTPAGRYSTFHKQASRHMARGNLAYNGYDLPGVPWNSYITEEGIAFHGTYWHNNFGKPRSHGCINMTPQASKWLYLWTMPGVPPEQGVIYEETGTTVDIIG